MDHVGPAVAEFIAPNDWSQRKLFFTGERLGIDYQPWLAFSSQNVITMQVLMDQNLLTLRATKPFETLERGIEQRNFKRPSCTIPVLGKISKPPGGFILERSERLAGFNP